MGQFSAENKQEYMDKLVAEVRKHVPDKQAEMVEHFVRQFFSVVGFEDLLSFSKSDIVGSTLSFWKLYQSKPADQPRIEVFNPVYEHHGWHSTHTVVQIFLSDSPFIVDSVRMRLNELGSTIHFLQNKVMGVQRSAAGGLREVMASGQGGSREALIYLEIDRLASDDELDSLKQSLMLVLQDVSLVVSSFAAVSQEVEALIQRLEKETREDSAETQAFLRWLLDNNFTFLGFEVLDIDAEADPDCLTLQPAKRLGLFTSSAYSDYSKRLSKHCYDADNREILSFSKSPVRSSVHRPAYPDCILVRLCDREGQLRQEARILGLYTSPVYTESPDHIPYLREKVHCVEAQSGLDRASHHGKELKQILDTFPRDELFQTPTRALFETVSEILQIQERRQIKLFIRIDRTRQFASCLIYVPRDVYSTSFREASQEILERGLNAQDSEFTTYFSESVLCRVQFNLRLDPEVETSFNRELLLSEIVQVSRSWEDELSSAVLEVKGEVSGNRILARYGTGFPASYKERFVPRTAVVDIDHLDSLGEDNPLTMSFYQSLDEQEGHLHFKVYHYGYTLPLSDLIPMLENLGLKVIGEFPYVIKRLASERIWIHDFVLDYGARAVDLMKVNRIFQDAFLQTWLGNAENDRFNRLVLAAQLSWREVAMLRGYARYLKQIRFGLGQSYIADTLASHVEITRTIVELFSVRFDPDLERSQEQRQEQQRLLEERVVKALDEVSVLNEDRILRRYLDLIKATLRTNFYQQGESGDPKSYISFKFAPRQIPQIPLPAPLFEIFVYSPRVEGVHLRGGKVARGGLRWSDRQEDFRTEVLGLVKAQQVKNAVIVPVGAKGGFFAKCLPDSSDREAFLAEGIASYRTFIRALLDITDNLVDGSVVHPPRVTRYDEDDPYLVVAADKGTATFSDIANELAAEYGFWLGDAFASGGSAGYDHKKMGITARGAWVSVQRHFRERGIDVQKESISVVGIGDMAGDVFGNGMLLSQKLAMVAAFNHLHIFIDPEPDVEASWKERKRLFDLPRSSWEDYNRALISKGGGVFSRAAKSIPISPQMQSRFGITEMRMTPTELITALLKSPVDLVWNGGIGTYVKSSRESHADVGDKANDALRVNGDELACRVIGEGGNLGATQLGRVEYCLHGGASNTDFIDNAGGVDCSDHEVNIKILLNGVVSNGDMTPKQRNVMLGKMTGEVAELVLENNYRQVQAISLAQSQARVRMDEYRRFIAHLEAEGKLNRAIEYLPDDEGLSERLAAGQGLTRPELSLLISYSKADLKEQLLASGVPDDPYLAKEANTAFPRTLVKKYGSLIESHRLRREIVSTQIANHMINMMGITFAHKLSQSTGASPAEIARAYVVARDVFGMAGYFEQIEQLDHKVSSQVQHEMMGELIQLTQRATRWFIRIKRNDLVVQEAVAHYGPKVSEFIALFSKLLNDKQRTLWEQGLEALVAVGVPKSLAGVVAGKRFLSASLSITQAADQTGQPLDSVARLFFALGDRLDINWFAQELGNLDASNQWQSMARESIRDELNWQLRALTVAILKGANAKLEVEQQLEGWLSQNAALVRRWDAMLTDLRSQGSCELAMFTVANRELVDLVQSSHS
ncbi:NAD-glutamate dehydrogenase [Aestuariirhabdus litorea]|uniref:NAD-glutamate dehydrogenase n=1 Tax=Aestuariirhabdus litorea TaxID=2528527 RepID=A0A3P3VQF3_9GAMM|nr:NAD-glutamate dehydrogenase [Aestuariirhabdus litorea]RRJ84850.1 NAD-glutamate dehydrogenase [Aestuariirhabdus litorea]RWW98077.1 NAD-glutamate dehydrogenase [Endozoicomonadaceae bacterium GTF-13]